MDSDTKSLLIGIVGSIIGGLIVFILLKSKLESQPSPLQQYQMQQYQQQIRQQDYQQYQQTQPLPLSSNY